MIENSSPKKLISKSYAQKKSNENATKVDRFDVWFLENSKNIQKNKIIFFF